MSVADLTLPERHLGLIQAKEHPDLETAIENYASFLAENVDLDRLTEAAKAQTSTQSTSDAASCSAPLLNALRLPVMLPFLSHIPHLLKARDAEPRFCPFHPADEAVPQADFVWLRRLSRTECGQLALQHVLNRRPRAAKTKPVHANVEDTWSWEKP